MIPDPRVAQETPSATEARRSPPPSVRRQAADEVRFPGNAPSLPEDGSVSLFFGRVWVLGVLSLPASPWFLSLQSSRMLQEVYGCNRW